jgi:ADP-ribosylglycohydrolase
MGYWHRAASPGAFTDDTQMTLFTAEGLIRAMQRRRDRGITSVSGVVWRAYLRWLDTQGVEAPTDRDVAAQRGFLVDVPELRRRMAPGSTCIQALRSGEMGTADHALNDSKGCGGVMRVAPVGLIANDPFELGRDLAAITHSHPTGYLAAGTLALIIKGLTGGDDLRSAVTAALGRLESEPDGSETVSALNRAMSLAENGVPSPARWIAEEALAISIYCAVTASGFREGVLLAVNHSGDSDSTGSITGQILGTQLGEDAIPAEWLEGLEARGIVERVADDFVTCFVDDEELSFADYPPN